MYIGQQPMPEPTSGWCRVFERETDEGVIREVVCAPPNTGGASGKMREYWECVDRCMRECRGSPGGEPRDERGLECQMACPQRCDPIIRSSGEGGGNGGGGGGKGGGFEITDFLKKNWVVLVIAVLAIVLLTQR